MLNLFLRWTSTLTRQFQTCSSIACYLGNASNGYTSPVDNHLKWECHFTSCCVSGTGSEMKTPHWDAQVKA